VKTIDVVVGGQFGDEGKGRKDNVVEQKNGGMQLVAVKRVGALGRIIVPGDVRKALGMQTGTTVKMYVDGNRIVLHASADEDGCALCGETETSATVANHRLCYKCVTEASEARKLYRRDD
jgi:bifunctional DNA-binding transcriptional regulator/antitoxin component of YhaV-PrlF toxin-antitoxin module